MLCSRRITSTILVSTHFRTSTQLDATNFSLCRFIQIYLVFFDFTTLHSTQQVTVNFSQLSALLQQLPSSFDNQRLLCVGDFKCTSMNNISKSARATKAKAYAFRYTCATARKDCLSKNIYVYEHTGYSQRCAER